MSQKPATPKKRAAPKATPVGWVYINQYRSGGITIRWRRGDTHAYILPGNKLGDHTTAGVLATIPVHPTGWADHTEIRHLAQRWQQHH
jgi:FtsP/CotA-like multicopper oxidase with cupredoxin domain